MVNILCVKWGKQYTADYANRLYKNVKKHLTIPFKFYCLTENADELLSNIEHIPLKNNIHTSTESNRFRGWWYKVEMFRPDLGLTGRNFFLDLDTVVVDNIDEIVSTQEGFNIVRDFYRGPRDKNAAQSCLMAWDAGKHAHLYTEFIKNSNHIMQTTGGGDQIWIERNQKDRKYWQDLFPDQIVSFKVDCVGGNRREWQKGSTVPKYARIVCFHGPPRPMEVAHHSWMKQHWR